MGSHSSTSANIPVQLQPLFTQSASRVMDQQAKAWGGHYEYEWDPETHKRIAVWVPGEAEWFQQHPREVADLNPALEAAWNATTRIGERPNPETEAIHEAYRLSGEAWQPVSGEAIKNSPFVEAALSAWDTDVGEGINNDMALMGLGKSDSLAKARAQSKNQMLLPLYQEAAGLEERRIGRGLGGRENLINLLGEMGRRETARTESASDRMFGMGKYAQDWEQSKFDAEQEDFMRRQGLAEQALFQPFGSFVPSTIGSRTTGK